MKGVPQLDTMSDVGKHYCSLLILHLLSPSYSLECFHQCSKVWVLQMSNILVKPLIELRYLRSFSVYVAEISLATRLLLVGVFPTTAADFSATLIDAIVFLDAYNESDCSQTS